MEERKDNIENNIELVKNEKGDIRLLEIYFSNLDGVVYGTFDMFKFINPSEKFLGYLQKALDLIQEGLYMEIYDEFKEEIETEIQEEREEFIKREMEDLEQMKKELGEEE